MKRLFLLLLAAALVFSVAAAAQGNVAELRIGQLPVFAKAGGPLEFSFTAGNMVGPACPANISYWIEANGKKISRGGDSVFLNEGMVEKIDAVMLLPSNIGGIYEFVIEMHCNDAIVLANKTIEAKEIIPALPLANSLLVLESGEGKQAEFSYIVQASSSEAVQVHVEEKILKEGAVLWENSQNVVVIGSTELKRLGPVLNQGSYTLLVNVSVGSEAARVERQFEVKQAGNISQMAPYIGAGDHLAFYLGSAVLLLIGAISACVGYPALKKLRKKLRQRAHAGIVSLAAEVTKERLCIAEAESSGVLGEPEINSLLAVAGFAGKSRANAFLLAAEVPIQMLVRGFIVTDRNNNVSCETSVAMKIANNTNRNWGNAIVLAEIPDFLAEDAGGILADCEMHCIEGTRIVKFLLPKIGAMQSAVITYRAKKIVSQAEANSVPLPAVVDYEEGKPLVIMQVKVELQQEKTPQKPALKAKAGSTVSIPGKNVSIQGKNNAVGQAACKPGQK